MTAAAEVARIIRERIPDWEERASDGLWQWANPSNERCWLSRSIAVDGRLRIMPTAVPPYRGPLIVAHNAGTIISIELPNLVDKTDLQRVLSVLEAAGVLPPQGPPIGQLDGTAQTSAG